MELDDSNEENFSIVLRQLFLNIPPFSRVLEQKDNIFQFTRMTQATQNKAYKCTIGTDYSERKKSTEDIYITMDGNTRVEYEVLVRIYGKGSDVLIDRKKELEIFKFVSAMDGMGSKLFATFENGYVAHYIAGIPLPLEEMRKPRTFTKIARKIAQWHKCTVPDDILRVIRREKNSRKGIWVTLHQWLDQTIKSDIKWNNPQLLKQVEKEIEEMENFTLQHHYDRNMVFAHNDVNHANVIVSSAFNVLTNDVDGIYFVDYEFSDFNYRAFDLGNHFCEWAGLDLQYEYYPSRESQYEFLRAYLTEFDGREPDQESVDELCRECNFYALVSHLLWYLWALNQKIISDIDYFDFEKYGQQRLDEYYAKKQDFLSL